MKQLLNCILCGNSADIFVNLATDMPFAACTKCDNAVHRSKDPKKRMGQFRAYLRKEWNVKNKHRSSAMMTHAHTNGQHA